MSTPPPGGGPPVSPERIFQFAFGYAPPLMLAAAVEHGVFDALADGPKTLAEVVTQTGASERGLRAVMNALVGLEFLGKDAEGRYTLTPESAAFLVSTSPAFLGGLLQHTTKQIIGYWLQLSDVVKTGRPAHPVNEEGHGAEFFEGFVEALFPLNYGAARALADALGLAQTVGTVRALDLAAGSGVWGVALAQASPHVQVTAVDWPGVLPVTRRVAERLGVGAQFDYLPGDLRTADFGADYDVAVLGHILHSEGETNARALLRKTFAALAPGGTVAIAEMVAADDRTGPPHALIFAVNMLVASEEGDTFSFGQMRGWLEEAGFTDVRTLPVPGPSPLILATRPSG